MANLKNITELPVAESADGLNLIVNDNGSAKQIAANAVGAQADWNVEDTTSPAYIVNKPNIAQADWLNNDETSLTHIINRPFYDTRKYDNIVLTFNGNMTNKEIVEANTNLYVVKLFDKAPLKQDLIGGQLSVNDNGEIYTVTITEDILVQNSENEDIIIIDEIGLLVLSDTIFNGFALSTGIWTACYMTDSVATAYISELSWHGVVDGELKQLSSKYISTDAQADWNETNKNSPAFIKNKPVEEWDLDLRVDIPWDSEASAQGAPVFTAADGYSYDALIAKFNAGECPKIKFFASQTNSSGEVMLVGDRYANMIGQGDMYAIFISIGSESYFVTLNSDGTFTM